MSARKTKQFTYIDLVAKLVVPIVTALFATLPASAQHCAQLECDSLGTGIQFGHPAVAQQDIDFGPYMASLQRRVEKAWKPIPRLEPKRALVQFKVHKSGQISDLSIIRSSDDATVDKMALEAIETASPFGPLPNGCSDDIGIQFTFDQSGSFGFKKAGDAWIGWVKAGHPYRHLRQF